MQSETSKAVVVVEDGAQAHPGRGRRRRANPRGVSPHRQRGRGYERADRADGSRSGADHRECREHEQNVGEVAAVAEESSAAPKKFRPRPRRPPPRPSRSPRQHNSWLECRDAERARRSVQALKLSPPARHGTGTARRFGGRCRACRHEPQGAVRVSSTTRGPSLSCSRAAASATALAVVPARLREPHPLHAGLTRIVLGLDGSRGRSSLSHGRASPPSRLSSRGSV